MSDEPNEQQLLDLLRPPKDGSLRSMVRSALSGRMPRVGRYQIQRPLGLGGVGVVYAARDRSSGEQVAIKLLLHESALGSSREDARARLLREGWVAAQLQHPAIVRMREHGIHEGRLYLVMDMIDGLPLDQWCEQRSPSAAARLQVLRRAGEGLAAAHAAGYVHRDFKPSNVIVDEQGLAYLVDFGLARPIRRAIDFATAEADVMFSITAVGQVSGTQGYLAPELRMGARASPSSDQYAFCVSAAALLEVDPSTRRSRLEGVSPKLCAAVLRGIEPLPMDRWPDMNSLLELLA